jgi:hypothetical protein
MDIRFLRFFKGKHLKNSKDQTIDFKEGGLLGYFSGMKGQIRKI